MNAVVSDVDSCFVIMLSMYSRSYSVCNPDCFCCCYLRRRSTIVNTVNIVDFTLTFIHSSVQFEWIIYGLPLKEQWINTKWNESGKKHAYITQQETRMRDVEKPKQCEKKIKNRKTIQCDWRTKNKNTAHNRRKNKGLGFHVNSSIQNGKRNEKSSASLFHEASFS